MKNETYYSADKIAKAYEYGYNALGTGITAPCQDNNVMDLIEADAPFGSSVELFKAWNYGFHHKNAQSK